MNTEVEKKDYLSEHLPYELKGLRSTLTKCMHTQDETEWNTNFVAFVVHARNLYQFLNNEKEATHKAYEYILGGYSANKNDLSKSVHSKIISQVAHPGKRTNVEKLTLGEMIEFAKWMEKCFADWLGKLEPPYSEAWDQSKAGVPLTYDHYIDSSSTSGSGGIIIRATYDFGRDGQS